MLPITASSTLTSKNYVDQNIWPNVKNEIDDFIDLNNINRETLDGIILTVFGPTRMAHYIENVHRNKKNAHTLKEDIDNVFNYKVKFINAKPKSIEIKVKNPYKNLYAEYYGVGRRGSNFKGDMMIVNDLE